MFSFCIRLVSLSVMFPSFIPVEAMYQVSLLLKSEYYIVCKHGILFNDSVTDGHLHGFRILAAAIDMSVQISVEHLFFSSVGYA